MDRVKAMKIDLKDAKVAVASADGSLSIWEKEKKGWKKKKEWKVMAQCLTWAKPCFGSILASSNNKEVTIWNEKGKKITHFEVSDEITKLEFGTQEEFMELAVCQKNASISFFRPRNELNADNWYINETIDLDSEVVSFCWNTSIFDTPSFIATTKTTHIWAFSEKDNKFVRAKEIKGERGIVVWAPIANRDYHLIAIATGNKVVLWRCEFNYNTKLKELESINVSPHQTLKIEKPVYSHVYSYRY